MDNNIRILPHVCSECKDLILPPFEELTIINSKHDEIIEVCRKCKDKYASIGR